MSVWLRTPAEEFGASPCGRATTLHQAHKPPDAQADSLLCALWLSSSGSDPNGVARPLLVHTAEEEDDEREGTRGDFVKLPSPTCKARIPTDTNLIIVSYRYATPLAVDGC